MVLAQRQKYRSMEENRKPRNRGAGLQELRGQLRDPSRLGQAVRERPEMRRMALKSHRLRSEGISVIRVWGLILEKQEELGSQKVVKL